MPEFTSSSRRAARLITAAFRLRCPNCGEGRMFSSWLTLRSACASCGFVFERGESDYFIGAYTINLIVAELIVVGLLVIIMIATWPDVPWRLVPWIIVVFSVPGVFATYPFSRSLWLALDLLFRPAEPNDFVLKDERMK